jgi:hypothetical protein
VTWVTLDCCENLPGVADACLKDNREGGETMVGRVTAGLVAAAGLIKVGVTGASSATANTTGSGQNVTEGHAAPPNGARATVRVSPNPTTERGQERATVMARPE